ncbi:MAG: HAD family hydrolase [Patescibacteria group bacterium]
MIESIRHNLLAHSRSPSRSLRGLGRFAPPRRGPCQNGLGIRAETTADALPRIMKAFIDFDGVLFDIARHKREYFRFFEQYGVSRGEARKTYGEMKRAIGRDDQRYYVSRLKEKHPRLDIEKTLRAIRAFKGQSRSCVYKEARMFLEALKKFGFELHLVTSGDKVLQERKIEMSGLLKYFQGIHLLENDDKAGIVRRFATQGEIAVFLDDKEAIADQVKKSMPHVSVLHVVRHKGDARSKKADYAALNLREALRYIKRLCAE